MKRDEAKHARKLHLQRLRRARDNSGDRRYNKQNPGVKFRSHLKIHYGITPEDYDRMFTAQNGKCAICGGRPRGRWNNGRLNVDHDHSTNKVRGLVCWPCNIALGKMRDDPAVLRRAADYLEGA